MMTIDSRSGAERLLASGLPVFFEVGDARARGLALPPNRHGQAIRVWARSLTTMQKEAIVASARTGRAWRLASDEGPYLNGCDSAPCPLAFFTTGMVAGYWHALLAAATRARLDFRSIELVQDNFYTMRGSALQGTMTGGALPVELEARVVSRASEAAWLDVLNEGARRAPFDDLVRDCHASRFALHVDGAAVRPRRVSALAPAPEPWPDAALPWSRPGEAPSEPLVERLEAVDPNVAGAGGAGTSLAPHQDRRLHVRGICRARSDGLLEVTQSLFSPRGSTFRFLSDEAPGFGGQGRAPDAASYLAAGIAFCFMTQLTRYAAIVKQPLEALAVRQDLQLPAEGPSPVDPVETHVVVAGVPNADLARTMLDMGEQTCFLHALCRTPLTVQLRVTRSSS